MHDEGLQGDRRKLKQQRLRPTGSFDDKHCRVLCGSKRYKTQQQQSIDIWNAYYKLCKLSEDNNRTLLLQLVLDMEH